MKITDETVQKMREVLYRQFGIYPTITQATRILEAAPTEDDTEWEYAGIPILANGEEWEPRSIAACEELVEEYADPTHWIHEPHNDDLSPVSTYRKMRRRKAGPWEPVPTEDGDS